MIAEVNRALTGLLEPLLPPGCEVRFGAPAPGGKALAWFLADVREDAAETDWTDVRDETGRVVARRPPVRRFDLHYLVTAEDPAAEATLLDAVLTAADPGRRVPPDLLPETLAGRPITLRLAGGAPASDRTALRVLVNAPLVLPPVTDVAAPAEDIRLGVAAPGRPAPGPPPPARPGPRGWRGSRIEEA
jgi:hypothetical protein